MKRLLLLAGEESGALYARQIAAQVRSACPDVEIRGYGDSGFETHDLAVMGFWAVLKRLFFFLRVKRTMEAVIDEWRPDVVCTVDYPGLNLKLAAYAKARGVRAVHVVCPQVWAWKAGRIPKIEASLDKLCCFFPFEPQLFKSGFAEFVGHPLVDAMAEPAGRENPGGSTLALLPGSRAGEIDRNLPTMLQAAERLREELPELRIVIPAASDRAYQVLLAQVRRLSPALGVSVTRGGARELLRVADSAIVASGTATLEAALAGCPTVLVYRVGKLLEFIARRLVKGITHIGLANIVAEKSGVEPPMPELIQDDFTVGKILELVRPWLLNAVENEKAREKLVKTVKLLKSDGDSIAKITHFLI